MVQDRDGKARTSELIHVSFSALAPMSRIERAARTALEAGICRSVHLIGYQVGDLPASEAFAPGIRITRVPLRRYRGLPRIFHRTLNAVEWNLAVLKLVRRGRPLLLQAHSLAALPASVVAARLAGCPLLYDAHELESERQGWPPSLRAAARTLERALIRFADHTIVVCDSIADWYRTRYRLTKLTTLRNIAVRPEHPIAEGRDIRSLCGVPADALLFVFLGEIDRGRGIEAMLDVFSRSGPDKHIVFMGYGRMAPMVEDHARRHANIHFQPPVRSLDVVPTIRSADVGMVFFDGDSLSYQYCLPNKLFECLNAGLPLICTPLRELSRFVTELECGWLCAAEPNALRALVATLDRTAVEARKEQVARQTEHFSWSTEREKLIGIYRTLLASRWDRQGVSRTIRDLEVS
ncbi:glycosyltransferase [Marinivivus vitaminiproducens]|uniref:glycosyltransferase n=1 Tax=Marinivivus vitaminiproducens TaxID=3035935 RepID=UPI0027A64B0F|nr:glycosyltransferase [Geminicoccaceae bacterium SCSIO 64248]